MRVWSFIVAVAGAILSMATIGRTQVNLGLTELQRTPAVSGLEQKLAAKIERKLTFFGPKTDNFENVWVTVGSGAPHRLVATSIDEPGYVVSQITEDGYLRVQRLPQAPPNAVFDALHFAQPVWVITRSGKEIRGVFAALSVHLQPGRPNSPKMNHVTELYVDIGARSAPEVRMTGVDVLDPIALEWKSLEVGHADWAGPRWCSWAE